MVSKGIWLISKALLGGSHGVLGGREGIAKQVSIVSQRSYSGFLGGHIDRQSLWCSRLNT